jgi:hypothetical protein
MRFYLVFMLFGSGEPDVILSGLSPTQCEFHLSEMQVILDEMIPQDKFELWCETEGASS